MIHPQAIHPQAIHPQAIRPQAIYSRISGQICVAAAVIALGFIVGFETTSIAVSPSYARIGPRVIPFAVAAGLLIVGGTLMFQALTGRWAAAPPSDHRVAPLATIALGLAGYALLMAPAGFVLASTLLFTAVARSFDSRRTIRDAAIGFTLSLTAYLFFTHMLQLPLPAGKLAIMISSMMGGL